MDSKFQIEPLPSGSLALKVRDVDKNRTKDLAKKYVWFLNEKANLTLNAKGRELRRFLERRIKEIEDSMKILGDSITAFERRAKILVLSAEDILAPGIAEMIKNIAQREVEISTLSAVFSEKIPDVSMLKKELDALRSNLSQKFSYLPENLRKAYDYKVRLIILSEVYKTVYAEYEKAKILEKKDNPIIQPASEPMSMEKKVWPKRVIPTFATALMMGLGTFFMLISFMISDRLRETNFGKLIEQLKEDIGL
jgi:capsule polysaccharide export protein KpsE/RkpR